MQKPLSPSTSANVSSSSEKLITDQSSEAYSNVLAHRFGEYGVVGAEQADESYYDSRAIAATAAIEGDGGDDDEGVLGADGRIKFSDKKLYGRGKEIDKLLYLFDDMTNDERAERQQNPQNNDNSFHHHHEKGRTPSCAFIAAYSGAGKSTLVKEFVKQLRTKRKRNHNNLHYHDSPVLFLRAKFEAMQNAAPFTAFQSLFQNIDDRERDELIFMKEQIIDVIEDDLFILAKLFPSLCQKLGLGTQLGDDGAAVPASSVGSTSQHSHSNKAWSVSPAQPKQRTKLSKEQLKSTVQRFFRILCTQQRPLILFIDDLQWADSHSLETIQLLLTDDSLHHLFFIGAYRSNEIDDSHKLLKTKQAVEERNGVSVETLELEELSQQDVAEFIADSLRLDIDEVETLAQAVFAKTMGNPFYTRQALEQLVRKNELYYDTITFAWKWNLDRSALEDLISDDIVDMVKHKICHLSGGMQKVLLVASHTRSSFDSEMLKDLLCSDNSLCTIEETKSNPHFSREMLESILNEAVEEGLLVRGKPNEYTFAHDRIEEASRSLVVKEEEEAFLRRIGKLLYERARSEHGEDWMYFASAQHLNSIASPERDEQERIRLAALNLETAKLSLELLSFCSAAEFCRQGIQNLPDDKWSSHYDLTLSLYKAGAESEYGQGNMEVALQYCDEVLKQQTKSFLSVLPLYRTKSDILTAKGEKNDAFDLSFVALEKMGFKFPKEESIVIKFRAWAAIRQVKARHIPSDKRMKEMPEVTDPDTVEIMEFLLHVQSLAFQTEKRFLYVLMTCESLRWMSKHGLVDSSASAIASFANIITHVYGDFNTGARLGELAISICNRMKNKFNEPRPLNTANAFVLGWVRPLRTCLQYHIRAHESGIVSGNLEGASVAKMFVSWNLLYAGAPLLEVETFCRSSIPKLRKTGNIFNSALIAMVWQISLNLMGQSRNTIRLIGDAVDETCEPYCTPPLSFVVQIWIRFLCCFFGNWDEGAKSSLENDDFFTKKMMGMMYGLELFHRGMCLYGMAREGDSKCTKPARSILREMKVYTKKGCINLIGPARILEGEQAVLSKNSKKAKRAFEDAISVCRQGDYVHYAALASERYAIFLHEAGKTKEACQRFSDAIDLYKRWGARAKVELLRKSNIYTASKSAS